MAKTYCLKCNFGTEWSSAKPNFCSKCGKPYIDVSEASQGQPATFKAPSITISQTTRREPQRPVFENSEDDDSLDATYVPKIDKIDCNFTASNLRPNRQSSEQVFAEGAAGVDRDFTPRVKPQKVGKKIKISKAEKQLQEQQVRAQFKNDFLKNGKNNRNSTEIE